MEGIEPEQSLLSLVPLVPLVLLLCFSIGLLADKCTHTLISWRKFNG